MEKGMDGSTKTFLDCYTDAIFGLRGAIKEASSPKCHDPLFWERSAADWVQQAIHNYRQLDKCWDYAKTGKW